MTNDSYTNDMPAKWLLHSIYQDYDGDRLATYKCSRCLAINDEKTPYCPHCGAKMEDKEKRQRTMNSKWTNVGKSMIINLENAEEQYKVLGYLHRTILQLRCEHCRKITMVDSSIVYDFCPHCGARMDNEEN